MKFCKHCGFPIPEGSRFCPGCGKRLSEDDLQRAPRSEDASSFDPSQNLDIQVELTEVTEPLPEQEASASSPDLSNAESPAPNSPYWLPTQTDVMKTERSAASQSPVRKTESEEESGSVQPVLPSSKQNPEPEEEKEEELEERGIRGMINRYKHMPEDLDDEEDDEEEYYSDPGGFRGGFLIGAGLCTALLVCLGLAFLNGWIRLPSKIEEEKQTEVADNSANNTTEPEEETVEDSADSFKKAFEKNNTTVPAEEEDENQKEETGVPEDESWTPYGSMNVRAKPDASSRKTGTIPAGEPVRVLETVTGPGGAIWGKIGANKYVCLQDGVTHFLVPTSEYTPDVPETDDDEEDNTSQNGNSVSGTDRDNSTTRKPGRNDD